MEGLIKKDVIIHHSRDLDGWMSSAIGMRYLDKNLDNIGWDYGDPIPDVRGYDHVYMFDISFSQEDIEDILNNNDYLVLIDHHKSAKYLEELKDSYSNFTFIHDSNYAACELVYNYFYPDKYIPVQVNFLGLYDSFRHINLEEKEHRNKVVFFQYACRAYFSNPDECEDLLVNYDVDDVDVLIESGEAIYTYLKKDAEITYRTKGSIVYYEGYKFIAFNRERFNIKNFEIDYGIDGFAGVISYFYNKNRWSFSIYSEYIDVSKIAEQFGGGGHKGAAGFELHNYNDFFEYCVM